MTWLLFALSVGGQWLIAFAMWMRWRERAYRLAEALERIEKNHADDPISTAAWALYREWPDRDQPRRTVT